MKNLLIIKNLYFLPLFMFILYNTSKAQTYNEYPLWPQNIERYEINGTPYYQTRISGAFWEHAYAGKQDDSPNDRNTFRAIYTWSVTSIPTTAIITSARLYFKGIVTSNAPSNETEFIFEAKQFPNANYNSGAQEQWNAISNSTILFTESLPRSLSPYNYYKDFTSGSNFVAYIQSSLSTGKFHLAFRIPVSSEETWGTNRNLHVIDFKSTDAFPQQALKLVINYTVPPLTLTAQNNFTGGRIYVDDMVNDKAAPYTFTKNISENVTLKAKEQIDNLGYNRIWNDNEAPNALSRWYKNGIPGSFSIENMFNATQSDNNAIYEAGLRKLFNINRNLLTDENSATELMTQIVEQNSETISAPTQQIVNGRTYNFAGWTDGETNNTRTITPADNETYTALYKLPHYSNQTNAFENSSARKFVKTSDGVMHLVYESMGRVWYEKSTNNGVNWVLMNDGKPLSFSESKSPTISLRFTTGNIYDVGIVYQEKNGDGYDLIFHAFGTNFTNCTGLTRFTIYNSTEDYYEEGEITFSWRTNGEVLAVWKSKENFASPEYILKYWYGAIGPCGITEYQQGQLTTERDAEYPTTGVYGNSFHITWHETGELFYASYIGDNTSGLTPSIERINISENNGYNYNEHPSLTVLNDNIARIAWIGQRMDETESMQSNVVFMAPDNPSHFWTFGNNVSSTNINRPDNVNAYVIGWSEDNGNVNKIVDNHLSQSYIRNLNQLGKDIQICNGATFSHMKATAFNTSNSPYSFNLSNDIQSYYGVSKNTSATSISEGREGIVSKNKLQFYFGMGDIKVDDELIGFKDIEESVRFSNVSTLNNYLTSKPFQLSDNSSFYYSVQFGITDTSFAQNTLTANSFVTFRVLLVDDNTNQLLGAYDEVTYTLANLLQHKNIGYQVNTTGIGNRTVRLVLEVTDNIEPKYALAEKYADDNVITKEKYETIEYKGKLGITEYALAQNYPNPFNPITTINYQIPKSGRVVLKVYDILGKEIATLVNEEKEIGRYSVNFDASKLSSGVYLYELVANDYRAVKKLMVIK